jgi:hypothetical protein
MRKAFNFYKSYADVYFELSLKDRRLFIEALLRKQFYNEDIELEGMAKFAYLSQKHSIDAQITGFVSQNGFFSDSEGATQGATIGATQAPSVQGEGEEKEEGKEQLQSPTIQEVEEYFNTKGYSIQSAQKAYHYYNEGGWKDSTGKKVRNWKQKMQGVWFKPENEKKKSNLAQYGY